MMNQHKTKVVALRLTPEEHEMLVYMAKHHNSKVHLIIRDALNGYISVGRTMVAADRKKAEAKAKRQAKKEAQSGVQS
jgi:predicted DNA-binding protein